ncbi:MAG: hypothetical protein JWQ88_1908 [Rhodoferax sp.]|nr:hypothetical protein [Rhodoferax sp.]
MKSIVSRAVAERIARQFPLAVAYAFTIACSAAHADTGKLLLTGGVTSIEGAAGGGLSPWAVIGSNATEGQVGATASLTRVHTQDYGLTVTAATLGWHDRLELSLARQEFGAAPAYQLNGIAAFGVAPDAHLQLDIVGVKLRVAGEAVLDSDRWMPQIAVGLAHKRVRPGSLGSVLDFLGTQRQGTDFYASATKLLLGQGVLLNATLRNTKANQNGLLGFGSAAPGKNRRSWQTELSAAYLLSSALAVGAEYRFKPNNLEALGASAGLGGALREDDWKDLFIAWTPSKHFSLTLAYVDLGHIVPGVTRNRKQSGGYLSAQLAF